MPQSDAGGKGFKPDIFPDIVLSLEGVDPIFYRVMRVCALLSVILSAVLPCSLAAEEFTAPQPRVNGMVRPAEPYYEDRVDFSFESAHLFDIGAENDTTVAPLMMSIRWQLDDVGNPGWRRGNTEWVFSAFFTPVYEAVENRFVGGLFGPRYNFVQPGSKWVPYIDSRVGFGFTDSQPVFGAQGQDFFFTFTVGAGVRYTVSEEWEIAGGVLYQHLSNAGLSEPERENFGYDLIGPHLSLQYRF